MSTLKSADGTTIAFEAWGEGRPLIMVDGATAHRAVNPANAEVAKLLSDEFRVYAYDRRGRGRAPTPRRTRSSGRSRISPR